jgi:hypothetical protein
LMPEAGLTDLPDGLPDYRQTKGPDESEPEPCHGAL